MARRGDGPGRIGGDPDRTSTGGSGDWTSGPDTGGRMGGEITGSSGADRALETPFSPGAFGTPGDPADARASGAAGGSAGGSAGVDQASGLSGWGDQARGVTPEAGPQGATATPGGGSQGGGPLGHDPGGSKTPRAASATTHDRHGESDA